MSWLKFQMAIQFTIKNVTFIIFAFSLDHCLQWPNFLFIKSLTDSGAAVCTLAAGLSWRLRHLLVVLGQTLGSLELTAELLYQAAASALALWVGLIFIHFE